jgi:hypothetical protein
MAATDPASVDTVQDAAAAARAARLEDEVKLLSRRLRDAEAARAGSESEIAALRAEADAAREEHRLWVRKAVTPLLALESGIRWLFKKTGRAIGMVARQVLFRGRRTDRGS